MYETSKHVGEGVITIFSEEGEKLYRTISENGMFWEKISLIFDEHAKMVANKNNLATKDDIKSLHQAIYNLSSKINTQPIGDTATGSVSNSPLVEGTLDLSGLTSIETPSKPKISFAERRRKPLSIQEMMEISKKQE